MKRSAGELVVVGPFPPPVNGMSVVTQRVADRLRAGGFQPHTVDLSPHTVRREWWSRMARLPVVGLSLVRFAWLTLVHRGGTVYLSLSGGPGQLYEAVFLALARVSRARILIQHHNYGYLRRKRLLTSLVTRIAGGAATHVVPCADHAQRLTATYPAVRRTVIVSNAAIFDSDPDAGGVSPSRRERVRTVGFLGNVSREKGIEEFLEVCRQLAERQPGAVRAVIAGPFAQRRAESAVRALSSAGAMVEYVGPVYDADKQKFYGRIDVLLFPSHQETDPLTIYEALGAGVPVIVLGRGCLPAVLADGGGILVQQLEAFVPEAVRQIEAWLRSPEAYRGASEAARARYRALVPSARQALDRLVTELCRVG